MALPTSGEITWGMLATEFNKPIPMDLSVLRGIIPSIPVFGAIALSDFYGMSFEIHKFVSAETDRLDVRSMFTDLEWAMPNRKVLHVPQGVVIGSTVDGVAAITVNDQQEGDLLIEIDGSVQGSPGLPGMNGASGGNGGNAISINSENVTVQLNPSGSISGGGGGGGSGGLGGTGGNGLRSVIAREPTAGFKADSFFYTNRSRVFSDSACLINSSGLFWNNTRLFNNPGVEAPSTFTLGEWTYHKGDILFGDPSKCENIQYSTYRTKPIDYTVDGSQGGQFNGQSSRGGWGQGYRRTKTQGLVGESGKIGSLGAGSGGSSGRGGDGGNWAVDGLPGVAGSPGSDGTASSGQPGQSGGLGGKAGNLIVATKPYVFINLGGMTNGVNPPFWVPGGAIMAFDFGESSSVWVDDSLVSYDVVNKSTPTPLNFSRSFVFEFDSSDPSTDTIILQWSDGTNENSFRVIKTSVSDIAIEVENASDSFLTDSVPIADGRNIIYGIIGDTLRLSSLLLEGDEEANTISLDQTIDLLGVGSSGYDHTDDTAMTPARYAEYPIQGTPQVAYAAVREVANSWE